MSGNVHAASASHGEDRVQNQQTLHLALMLAPQRHRRTPSTQAAAALQAPMQQ